MRGTRDEVFVRDVIVTAAVCVGLALLFWLAGQALVHGQTTGLAGAYAMESGLDASGNHRDAALTNTALVVGQYGQALSFNGTTSRMTIPTLQPTTAFTLEAWVNANVIGRAAAKSGLFIGPRSVNGWSAVIYKGLDNFFLAAGSGVLTAGFTTGTTLRQVHAPSAYAGAGSWHHLAATYNGTALMLYQDGAVLASISASGTLVASPAPVEVGGSQVDGGNLAGVIDDVRIWTVARTGAEIVTDMNTRVDAVVEPVLSWDLEVWGGVDFVGQNVIAVGNFSKNTATCGLTPASVPPTTVENPTHARVTDPDAMGKECEIPAKPFFDGVPLGHGFVSTARARSASAVSDRSPTSNPFNRVAEAVAPPTPGKGTVIAK